MTTKKTPRTPLSRYTDTEIATEHGKRMRAKQAEPPRAKVIRPCPRCGVKFGARDLRAHLPTCHPG